MGTLVATANVKSVAVLRSEADAPAADVVRDDEQLVNRPPARAVITNVLRGVDKGILKLLLIQDSSSDQVVKSRVPPPHEFGRGSCRPTLEEVSRRAARRAVCLEALPSISGTPAHA